jgi:hypothetical protein
MIIPYRKVASGKLLKIRSVILKVCPKSAPRNVPNNAVGHTIAGSLIVLVAEHNLSERVGLVPHI